MIMTDTTESTAVVSRPERPAREIRVVESVSPIMDTARFEHLGRVATVMARAGLMPMSLTHYKEGEGKNAVFIPLDFETVQARAFLIANQADLWKADPNAVAQCCSLVHGKLMFEGKLVHGLIETRLGIKLRYQFGAYVSATRSIDLDTMPGADDQGLGVLVTGRFPDEDFDREIVGSVGMWHKGSLSPWSAPTAWPRQLRYMGAREWARAHSPGLLLGIMTDDEIDAARDDRRPTETLQPVEQPRISTGFTKPAETALAAQVAVDEVVETVDQEMKHDADGVVKDDGADLADGGEGVVIAGESEQEAETEQEQPAQDVPADPVSTPSESLPSEPSSAAPASQSDEALDPEEEPEVIAEGYPDEDEVYHLTGDAWGSAGRRETYKNGKPFSSATRRAAHRVYEDHKPEGPGGQTAAELTKPAEVENSDGPADPGDPPFDAFDAYTMGLSKVETWAEGKAALNALSKTDAWAEAMKGVDGHRVRQARMSLALRGEELKAKGKPWIDVLDDLTAFRCWVEITEDADAIQGNFNSLVPTPLYQGLNEAQRNGFTNSIKARMNDIREGRA